MAEDSRVPREREYSNLFPVVSAGVVHPSRKERALLSTAHEVVARPTLFVDGFLEDPYTIYREFQSQGSMHFLQWSEGCNYWTVFSYADVFSALKDQRLSARRTGSFLLSLPESERAQFSELVRLMGQWLLFMDAPEHSRLRKLMNKGFAPSAIELLRPQVETIVDRMLAPWSDIIAKFFGKPQHTVEETRVAQDALFRHYRVFPGTCRAAPSSS
jgi:cytochrome P450